MHVDKKLIYQIIAQHWIKKFFARAQAEENKFNELKMSW